MDERENKGRVIAEIEGNIRRVSESIYRVKSQSGNGEYRLIFAETGWICNCPDSQFRRIKCKHSWAVEISQKLREKVEQSIVIKSLSTT
ncbi:MAG: SWIM zinc finger family protein, partial [Rhabdochlamydiaceae bacterium]